MVGVECVKLTHHSPFGCSNVTRLDLAAQSLSTVVKVFNAAFPRDDPVLPIMTAYAQVSRVCHHSTRRLEISEGVRDASY